MYDHHMLPNWKSGFFIRFGFAEPLEGGADPLLAHFSYLKTLESHTEKYCSFLGHFLHQLASHIGCKAGNVLPDGAHLERHVYD
jgi:hypothetical protein